ncbi:universal stress protein [Ramlibacter tataouinensis]|uniref:universal stress protein n=1 Tax=Ramlibacter tataouinensis TaxID=94132 RepID=UPI0022F394B2|nr:universal stress protein [Ramlibacter tataouinensis]WBY01746.1 universal stress protein [Ramlibacter tataouinensis]
MLREILLAYDNSRNSEAALALGFDLGRSLNPLLHVVTVIGGGTGPAKGPELEADRRAAWQTLRSLERGAARAGISIQMNVLVGDAAAEILKRTTEMSADILVLGRSQSTTVERLAFGSVADLVLAEAPCAVLLPKVANP